MVVFSGFMGRVRSELGQKLERHAVPELRLLDIAKELGVLPKKATIADLTLGVYSQMILEHTCNYAKELGYLPNDAGREVLTLEVSAKMIRDGRFPHFLPDGGVTGWASRVLERGLYRPPYTIL